MRKRTPEVQKMIKNFKKDMEGGLTKANIAEKYGIAQNTINKNKDAIIKEHGESVKKFFPSRNKKNIGNCISTNTTKVEETQFSEVTQKSRLEDFDEKCNLAKEAINGMIELIQATRKQLEEN